MTYDVFISYSSKDTSFSGRICSALKNAGISYFIEYDADCRDIDNKVSYHRRFSVPPQITKRYHTVIEPAIKESGIFLLVADKDSFKSPLINSEILCAKGDFPMGLFVTDNCVVPPDINPFFYQTIYEYPGDVELANDILQELKKSFVPIIMPEIPSRDYSSQELSDIVEQGNRYKEEKKKQKAFGCYWIAANHGNAEAQYEVGKMLNNLDWIVKSAGQGYLEARYHLGEEDFPSHLNSWKKLHWYRKAAEQGNTKFQVALAKTYEFDHCVRDYTKAIYWYKVAAENGDAYSQKRLGDCYANGFGAVRNNKEAIRWYRMAAENTDQNDCFHIRLSRFFLGKMYANGSGVPQDFSEAAYWFGRAVEYDGYERFLPHLKQFNISQMWLYPDVFDVLNCCRFAAERGNVNAQYCLGLNFFKGKYLPKDYSKATHWFRMAAEQGHKESQYIIGIFMNDDSKSAQWYRKAANQGLREAQYELGLLYDNGVGLKQNYAKASFWYRKAAEQGHVKAQDNLASMYYNGEGVKENLKKAEYWYLKAARKGSLEAQYYLGEDCSMGDWDLAAAARWYWRAASGGHSEAQNVLGCMFRDGRGVIRDKNEAKNWFRRAAEKGNALAQRNLDQMN